MLQNDCSFDILLCTKSNRKAYSLAKLYFALVEIKSGPSRCIKTLTPTKSGGIIFLSLVCGAYILVTLRTIPKSCYTRDRRLWTGCNWANDKTMPIIVCFELRKAR